MANILKSIETTSDLKSKYLIPFQIPEDTYAFLQCDPFHAKGVEGFFNRLFKLKKSEQDTGYVKQKKDVEEEQSIRSFFKNLFKKKDK
ncbi:MAG TPA: hypothetical protein VHO90_19180 [Bacteroidales bacterium]|nr:hypothetical protein [Bacteroidales bacterium]